MKAFVYRNTKSIPGVWGEIHQSQQRGMAYETDRHFVHIYGSNERLWTVSTGLTVTEKKNGSLTDWIIQKFGAQDIETTIHDVGLVTRKVWRPGIFDSTQMLLALGETNVEVRRSEQALYLLVQRLEELLLYVEPTPNSLNSYSHKSRELLILSCTEIEAQWKHYLILSGREEPQRGFTTNDYVDVCAPLYLQEYAVSLPRYKEMDPIRPFQYWAKDAGPTKTLAWYSAYNRTKHDRTEHFDKASLQRCIEAVSANLILFAVLFGPYRLYQGAGTLAAYVNTTFTMHLEGCEARSFYVPPVSVAERGEALTWGHADVNPWMAQPFKL